MVTLTLGTSPCRYHPHMLPIGLRAASLTHDTHLLLSTRRIRPWTPPAASSVCSTKSVSAFLLLSKHGSLARSRHDLLLLKELFVLVVRRCLRQWLET